jgi:hypothetical protein
MDVELDTVLDDADDGREDVVVDVGDAEGFDPSPNADSNACEEVGSKAKLALVTVDDVDDDFD